MTANRLAEAFKAYNASAWGSLTVTKSDVTIFPSLTRGLWVGGAGDVAVRMADGTTPTYSAVPAGTLLPYQVDQVLSTGTTATLIVAVF